MEEKLASVEARAKSNSYRLDRLESRMDETEKLVAAMIELKSEQGRIKEDVKEIKEDVKALTRKPGKRWDAAVEAALICLLTSVITCLLSRIG